MDREEEKDYKGANKERTRKEKKDKLRNGWKVKIIL